MATITYSTLDHVSDGFLYQLNPDGEQVHVNLEGVSLSLLKVNQSEGIPLFLQPGGANGTNNGWFNLTDASSELNATIQSHLSAAGLPPNTNIGIKVRKTYFQDVVFVIVHALNQGFVLFLFLPLSGLRPVGMRRGVFHNGRGPYSFGSLSLHFCHISQAM